MVAMDNNRLVTKEEADAWFNAPPPSEDEEQWHSLLTIDNPSEVSPDEQLKLHESVSSVVKKFGIRISTNLLSAKIERETKVVGVFSGDRTYAIEMPPEMLKKEVIFDVQEKLKREHSSWRIVFFGVAKEYRIFVDASSIGFMDVGRAANFEASLAKAVKAESEYIDSTIGFKRRQLEWVKIQLKQKRPKATELDEGPYIVAVFDLGNKRNIWLICHDGMEKIDWNPLSDDLSYLGRTGRYYSVDTLGEIVSDADSVPQVLGELRADAFKVEEKSQKVLVYEANLYDWKKGESLPLKGKHAKRIQIDISKYEMLTDQILKERLAKMQASEDSVKVN